MGRSVLSMKRVLIGESHLLWGAMREMASDAFFTDGRWMPMEPLSMRHANQQRGASAFARAFACPDTVYGRLLAWCGSIWAEERRRAFRILNSTRFQPITCAFDEQLFLTIGSKASRRISTHLMLACFTVDF
ncbi:hypothetical protein A9O66_27940 [Paraburkholderia caribensis]|uniref:Uncharacterized protein n=1 Tax=Paraburkholderia caribensis TaxID=75105 RepID=A0A9Q6WPE0_9BURK|nr:hypothetical protein A9O66_27940 [Paraburkholderia caribensis]